MGDQGCSLATFFKAEFIDDFQLLIVPAMLVSAINILQEHRKCQPPARVTQEQQVHSVHFLELQRAGRRQVIHERTDTEEN